jgi:hypothetical protein
MSQCIGWYKEFERNMNAMGAPIPAGLFDSYDKAISTLGALVAAASVNPAASAGAVLGGQLGAGPMLVGLAAISAAAYAGVVAGSLLAATYYQTSCAMQSRVLYSQITPFLQQNGIYDGGMIQAELMRNPRILGLVA